MCFPVQRNFRRTSLEPSMDANVKVVTVVQVNAQNKGFLFNTINVKDKLFCLRWDQSIIRFLIVSTRVMETCKIDQWIYIRSQSEMRWMGWARTGGSGGDCKAKHWHRFFLNPVSCEFPIGVNDTLKSIQSSDLGPTFSCWEACPGFTWSANANKLQENWMTEQFLRFS